MLYKSNVYGRCQLHIHENVFAISDILIKLSTIFPAFEFASYLHLTCAIVV